MGRKVRRAWGSLLRSPTLPFLILADTLRRLVLCHAGLRDSPIHVRWVVVVIGGGSTYLNHHQPTTA